MQFFELRKNRLVRDFALLTIANSAPLYVINEYPKSGGSWVGQMISRYMGVPFPRNTRIPFSSCVVHGHFFGRLKARKIVHVWRDIRDVSVSFYYHSLFRNDYNNGPQVRLVKSETGIDEPENIRENLPRFLEYLFVKKVAPAHSWSEFVDRWYDAGHPGNVRYEDLRTDPVEHMVRVLSFLSDRQADEADVGKVVDAFSFERLTGRKPGQEAKNTFLRKGIVGDWKKHFSRESREIIQHHAGAQMQRLGYVDGPGWVDEED